jgi:RNA polymerase sigma-70 factor (ECF subfamily)
VELYAPLIYGYARKHGLQDADALDLSQEVLGAVAGAVGRLEYDPGQGSFRNWLHTVVWRRLSNWRRAQRTRPRGSGDAAIQHLLEQRPAREEQEAEWQAGWDRRVFTWACERVRRDVTEVTWQAFWRTAVDGRPGKEVAASLGLSIAAVYLARSRVVARLKELVRSVQEAL